MRRRPLTKNVGVPFAPSDDASFSMRSSAAVVAGPFRAASNAARSRPTARAETVSPASSSAL